MAQIYATCYWLSVCNYSYTVYVGIRKELVLHFKRVIFCGSHCHKSMHCYVILMFYINLSGAEDRIFQQNQFDTMAADVLAPCITKTSVAMVFYMCNSYVLVFHESESQ